MEPKRTTTITRESLLEEALQTARSIEDPMNRSRMLLSLVHRVGEASEQVAMIREAGQAADAVTRAEEKSRQKAVVTEREASALIRYANELTDPQAKAAAVAEAKEVIDRIESAESRAAQLAALSDTLS